MTIKSNKIFVFCISQKKLPLVFTPVFTPLSLGKKCINLLFKVKTFFSSLGFDRQKWVLLQKNYKDSNLCRKSFRHISLNCESNLAQVISL